MFSASSTLFAAYFVHYVERCFAAFLLTFHLLQVHFQNSFERLCVMYVYGSVMFLKGGQFISNNLEHGNDKLIK
jgi:hypothetical protein